MQAIENVYEKELDQHNMPVFLSALKYEHKKDGIIAERAKEMPYEIVANLAAKNPDIVSELKNFNKDTVLLKDVLRYKAQRRND
ncbi:MAG: hypothetical protein KF746_10345 [Chitinophagaceae bacterium]|nr:hypothetical protein [Chitinophagaceae bacterium]